MHPNTFVSVDFFNILDQEYKNLLPLPAFSTSKEFEEKLISVYRIRNLLLASNIYSDLTDKDAIKYYNKEFGSYNNLKDQILHTKIKDASYLTRPKLKTRQEREKCSFNGFCYFTNQELNDCIEERRKTGKIVLGKDFLQTPFYIKNSFPAESTDETIFQISKSKHPCTGIIIIDQYLFVDTPRRNSKIPNLVSFLRELISPDLTSKFQVDIITAKKESTNTLFENKCKKILESFSNNISLHVYAPPKMNDENDRYLLTNYAVFSIGHPFDRKSNVSCSFYPSNNNIQDIHISFNFWREKIEFAKSMIKSTPLSFGASKAIWKSDDLIHSIYETDIE